MADYSSIFTDFLCLNFCQEVSLALTIVEGAAEEVMEEVMVGEAISMDRDGQTMIEGDRVTGVGTMDRGVATAYPLLPRESMGDSVCYMSALSFERNVYATVSSHRGLSIGGFQVL